MAGWYWITYLQPLQAVPQRSPMGKPWGLLVQNFQQLGRPLHCVQKKYPLRFFLSPRVDLNKNCSEHTEGTVYSDNVEIRYSLTYERK